MIIFGHGFSQPVRVYMGTLRRLARELGAVIIAPYTSLAVAFPWKCVQGAGAGPLGALTAPPPAKLQVRILMGFGRGLGVPGPLGALTAPPPAKLQACTLKGF